MTIYTFKNLFFFLLFYQITLSLHDVYEWSDIRPENTLKKKNNMIECLCIHTLIMFKNAVYVRFIKYHLNDCEHIAHILLTRLIEMNKYLLSIHEINGYQNTVESKTLKME